MNGWMTSPTIGIMWMAATIGVTNTGPITGICCNHASGGVWITATGAASAVTAAASFGVETLTSDDPAGVVGTNVSLRAAAATVQETGESGGDDGDPPVWGSVRSTTAAGTAVTASCDTAVGVGAVLDASGIVAWGSRRS